MKSFKDVVEDACSRIHTPPLPLEILSRLTEYPINRNFFDFPISDAELSEFYQLRLCKLINQLLEAYLTKENVIPNSLIERMVSKGKVDVIFRCLVNRLIDKSNGSLKLDLLLPLLEAFVFKHRILSSVFQLVLSDESVLHGHKRFFDEFSRCITNLPTHLANVSRGLVNSKFFDRYAFVYSVLSALNCSSDISNQSQLCGMILSHFVLSGYASEVVKVLLTQFDKSGLTKLLPEDEEFWGISCCALKDECIEPFILALLKNSPHPKYVEILLKSCFQTPQRPTANYFFKVFRRLLFVRYFPNGILLRNLFGALNGIVRTHSEVSGCDYLFVKVNSELGYPSLQLWSDVSSLQNTPVEQRLYISQSLVSWLMDFYLPLKSLPCFTTSTFVLLPEVLSGISNHLASPRADIRMLGMAVGEWLMRIFPLPANSNEDCILKFDYEETDYVKKIKPFFEPLPSSDQTEKLCAPRSSHKESEDTQGSNSTVSTGSNTTLDSDDESETESSILNPLPRRSTIESQTSVIAVGLRKPRYLRECLDGMLMSRTEDNEVSVACFSAAAELIRAHPEAAKELVTDFARVLIHVEPPPSPNDTVLADHQHAALVSLGVVAPKECSHYLTNEFAQFTCSFGQRLRILSAITDIAHELSGSSLTSNKGTHTNSGLTNTVIDVHHSVSSVPLKGITRRFCMPRPPQTQTTNAFAPIAGDFFFPLLNSVSQLFCASQRGTFAHQDAAVLSNLITTLGTIYACASLSPVQMRMASEFFELLPVLYRHIEPAVRQASLLTLGTIITATPSIFLSSNLALFFNGIVLRTVPNHNFSLVQWLEQCSIDDTDKECRVLASISLSALMERALEISPG